MLSLPKHIATIWSILAATVHSLHLPTPVNGYFGDLRTTITCQSSGLNVTLDGEFAATGPLVLQAGQPFYAEDISGNLTIPSAIGTLVDLLGVDYVDTKLFISLDFVDLYPEHYEPIPNGLWVNGSKLAAFEDSTLRFPQQGVLGGVGPITAGAAGTTGLVYLSNITAEMYLYGSSGNLILGPVEITCPIPTYKALLATFNTIANTTASPPAIAPANGYLVDFPPLDENTQFGCFDYQYACAIGDHGTFPFGYSTCGGAGALYIVGQEFTEFNTTTVITIPSSVVSSLKQLFPGTTTLQLNADHFFVEVTNAQPSSLDVIPSAGYTEIVAVPETGDLVFAFPSSGSFNSEPAVVSNAPGDVVNFIIGNFTAHIIYFDVSGDEVGETEVFCHTYVPNLTAIGVTIVPEGAENTTGLTGI